MEDMFECSEEYIPILDDDADDYVEAETGLELGEETGYDNLVTEKELETYNDDTDYDLYSREEECYDEC